MKNPRGVLYIVLLVLMLLPVVWVVGRSSTAGSAQPPSVVQQQASLPANSKTLFQKYTTEGFGYYERHDLTNATAAFVEALKYAPDNPEALNNLGYAYNLRGEYELAIPLFQRAIAIEPTIEVARNNLAWALAQKAKR